MRRTISLSTILLFILIPLRLSLVQFSSDWGFIFTYLVSFIILFSYLIFDLIPLFLKKHPDFFNLSKLILLSLLAVIIIFIPLFSHIHQRIKGEQYALVHDGIVQTEEAIKYLLAGKNFYTKDYINTPLSDWSGGKIQEILSGEIFINPALYHNIYLPFYILSAVPFYSIFNLLFHWYDQRIILVLVLIMTLGFILKIGKLSERSLLVIILFLFNPLFINFFIEGRNDIFIIFLIILTVYFLLKGKDRASSIPFALACVSKHSAWFLFPFYWLYLYYRNTPREYKIWDQMKKTVKLIYPFFLVVITILLPFLVWDFSSFWEDIFLYPSGKIVTSYPITGYGFSQFLLKAQLGVKTIYDYFPFWIIQIIIGFPLLFVLARFQKKNNSLSQMLVSYGIFLFVFWLFSRFFNDNYIVFLIIIFLLAYFLSEERIKEDNYKETRL